MRIIEYRLHPHLTQELEQQPHSHNSSPADSAGVHRLLTTLLDPMQAPAREPISCYYDRWEVELVIDELKTHQCLSDAPCAAKTRSWSIKNSTACS